MLSGSLDDAERIEPVRQRPDHRVEQPGPVEAGQEGRHRPGQEHQRLHDGAAGKRPVEQQRQDQAEDELQQHRSAGPPQRVAQRPVEIVVAVERAEMFEPDEAARERIEQLHVAEGIGKAEHQRHQHDRDDQDQRRRASRDRARRRAPSGRTATGAAAREGRRLRRRPSSRFRCDARVSRDGLPASPAAARPAKGGRLRPLAVRPAISWPGTSAAPWSGSRPTGWPFPRA